jgi:hypothetical protein
MALTDIHAASVLQKITGGNEASNKVLLAISVKPPQLYR